jgi:hypothetical protein
MSFHKMVDMARTPAEIKKDLAPIAMPSPDATAQVYPYGLCLSFDQDILDKLELDGACSVGDTIHLVAFAKVTSCSENERERADGTKEKCCRIELQITQLAVEDEDAERERVGAADRVPRERRIKQRYGEGEDAGDGDRDED